MLALRRHGTRTAARRADQLVGWPVEGWSPWPLPPRTPMIGRFATVEPLDPDRHAAELFDANSEDREGRLWTSSDSVPSRRFRVPRSRLVRRLRQSRPALSRDPRTMRKAGRMSVAVYQNWCRRSARSDRWPRVRPAAPAPPGSDRGDVQLRGVFDELGYRRLEWKRDVLNLPSRAAAAEASGSG